MGTRLKATSVEDVPEMAGRLDRARYAKGGGGPRSVFGGVDIAFLRGCDVGRIVDARKADSAGRRRIGRKNRAAGRGLVWKFVRLSIPMGFGQERGTAFLVSAQFDGPKDLPCTSGG